MLQPSALPYSDAKSSGAPDFYFAINATFRFLRRRFGEKGLQDYWTDLGIRYMAPVWRRWKEGGLDAIAAYWDQFFAAEPGAEVKVSQVENQVIVDVYVCPAIQHLRAGARAIDPGFCQHCYFVSEAAARQAGFSVLVQGGNGSCRQSFFLEHGQNTPQRLEDISGAS